MFRKNLSKLFSGMIAFCLLPISTYAGGLFLYEISTADTRLASAGWSARAQDPSTLFTNPAGMTRLCGKQAEIGAQAIFAHIHFEPNDKTSIHGSDGGANIWLPSGSFFYIHPYHERLTLGIGSLGYFGADLVYNHHWVGRYYVQKALMEGLSLVPAAAYKIDEHWSIGAGLNVMYGFFKQRAAVRNILDRQPDGYLSLHDYRFGYGGVFGILYEPTCYTRMGIQYLTPVKINFRDKPKFSNIGPLLSALLKEIGIIGSSVNAHIKVPQGVMLSIYHEINSQWSVMGNAGWQQWSEFEKVSINLGGIDHKTLTSKIKYQDTWHAAIGAEWHHRNLTISSGIAYDSSAISNSERPLDFPIGQQWRFGTGFRWSFSPRLVLDFSSELQWQGNLKCDVNKSRFVGHVSGRFNHTYALFINSNLTYLF